MFCAAPILGARDVVGLKPKANYWAVGIDCCEHRGSFKCGDVSARSSVSGGLVVLDSTPEFRADIPMYTKAAEQAAAQNDLAMPTEPIFVYWNSNAQRSIDALRHDAFIYVFTASLGVFILMLSVVACCNGLHSSRNHGDTHQGFFDRNLLGDNAIVSRFFASQNKNAPVLNTYIPSVPTEDEAYGDRLFTGHGDTLGARGHRTPAEQEHSWSTPSGARRGPSPPRVPQDAY